MLCLNLKPLLLWPNLLEGHWAESLVCAELRGDQVPSAKVWLASSEKKAAGWMMDAFLKKVEVEGGRQSGIMLRYAFTLDEFSNTFSKTLL